MDGDELTRFCRADVFCSYSEQTRRGLSPGWTLTFSFFSHKALLGFRQQAEAAVAMGVTGTGEGPPSCSQTSVGVWLCVRYCVLNCIRNTLPTDRILSGVLWKLTFLNLQISKSFKDKRGGMHASYFMLLIYRHTLHKWGQLLP